MTSTAREQELASRLGVLSIALLLAFLLLEGLLRWMGIEPWRRGGSVTSAGAGAHVTEPVLGWSKKAGRFDIECLEREIVVTHWEGGLRATAVSRRSSPRPIVLLGGSFAYGFCLDDHDTMAWRLQTLYPEVEWQNRATSGYGTYQSLLSLERYFAADSPVPSLVIYAFNQFHAMRNVAPPDWRYRMARYSASARFSLPYVTLSSDGSLERRRRMYPDWPLKRSSALITLLERGYNQLYGVGREYKRQEVTEALILEMDRLTRDRGSRLLVMTMGVTNDFRFFSREGIRAIDCGPKGRIDGLYLSDGHPTARLNADYAACLRGYLEATRVVEELRAP